MRSCCCVVPNARRSVQRKVLNYKKIPFCDPLRSWQTSDNNYVLQAPVFNHDSDSDIDGDESNDKYLENGKADDIVFGGSQSRQVRMDKN